MDFFYALYRRANYFRKIGLWPLTMSSYRPIGGHTQKQLGSSVDVDVL